MAQQPLDTSGFAGLEQRYSFGQQRLVGTTIGLGAPLWPANFYI